MKTVTNIALTAKEYLFIHKCELDTPLPWIFVNEDHMIDGAPALTTESQCTCRYGGIIYIVVEGEEEENVELEQVDDLVSRYENELLEKYGDAIETYCFASDDDPAKEQARLALEEVNIMDILHEMADEINGLPAIQNNKNDFLMFIDLVNSNQPLDLKNRKMITSPVSEQKYSIWSLPWGDGNQGTITQGDYTGNWLFGYVGSEYFTTPDDDDLLKYGAGAAQLWSDLKNKGVNESYGDILKKYMNSMLSGNYGDNINNEADKNKKNDPEMIQDGIDAYREATKKK